MRKRIERRSFLHNLTLGFSTVLLSPFLGSARDKNVSKEEIETMKKIIRTKALGFQWETQDPFLFCVHHEDNYPKGNAQLGPDTSLEGRYLGQDFIVKDGWRMYHGTKVPGFPGHPHRGFETITVVRKGLVDHADSTGAAGRYGNGDVQWMTAGKGVQHSEMFPLLNQDTENPLELFQIWLNLPRSNKMVEPHFKMIWGENVPRYTYKDQSDKSTEIEVLIGNLESYASPSAPPDSWAAKEENNVAIYNLHMQAGAQYTLPATSAGINRSIYFYEGDTIKLDEDTLPFYHAADVVSNTDITITAGNETCKVLVLQGKPISEPVVQHGPFVMNSREEIYQAFEDYQRTQFGGWPWPSSDYTHSKELGRFAKHSDGTLETKG